MEIEFSSISKIGTRSVNEDSIGIYEKDGNKYFVLADGLGGHGGGDEASSCVVNSAINTFKQCESQDKSVITKAFNKAQQALLNLQKKAVTSSAMRTTLVIASIFGNKAYCGHIGDSRLYVIRNNKIVFRTKDHSVPQMLVAMGEITDNEIRKHVDRNKLLKVMGGDKNIFRYELSKEFSLMKGDSILLCSDGVWEWISDRMIIRHRKKSEHSNEWLIRIEQQIMSSAKNKDMDNYSAIAVFVK